MEREKKFIYMPNGLDVPIEIIETLLDLAAVLRIDSAAIERHNSKPGWRTKIAIRVHARNQIRRR